MWKAYLQSRRPKKYVIHIRALKQALNHGLILKKAHRVVQFNQRAWLKSYIDIDTEKTRSKKRVWKGFL